MNHPKSNNFEDLILILEEIKEKAKLLGVILAAHDGNLIFENVGHNFKGEKFSSMYASVVESATGLGQTLGNRKIKKIITELGNKTLITVECSDKTFLTLVVNNDSNVYKVLNDLQNYISKLNNLL